MKGKKIRDTKFTKIARNVLAGSYKQLKTEVITCKLHACACWLMYYVHIYVCVHVHVYVYVYVCVCVYVYVVFLIS